MFAMLLVVAVCLIILTTQGWRLATRRSLSPSGWIMTAVALLPIAGVVGVMILNAGTEYNPPDGSLQRIAGTYTNGDASLVLRMDGTYSAQNLKGLNSGTWSNFDWNLTFSGSALEQPRWIIRRGEPAILPYYSGADGADGLILKKRSEAGGGDSEKPRR